MQTTKNVSSRVSKCVQNLSSPSRSPRPSNYEEITTQTDFEDWQEITSKKSKLLTGDGEIDEEIEKRYHKCVEYINYWNGNMNELLKNNNVKINVEKNGKHFEILPITNFMTVFSIILNTKEISIKSLKTLPKQSSSHHHSSNCTQSLKPKQNMKTSNSCHQNFGRTSLKKTNPKELNKIHDFSSSINVSKEINFFSKTPSLEISSIEEQQVLGERDFENYHQDFYHQNDNNVHKNQLRPSTKIKSANTKTGFNSKIIKPIEISKNIDNRRNYTKIENTSDNSVIASQLNSKGTPILVKNMFNKIQIPKFKAFQNRGNILRNILTENQDSDQSSIVSSDLIEQQNFNRKYEKEKTIFTNGTFRKAKVNNEFQHPLQLTKKDLYSADKKLINQIGIFTETGEIKPQFKNYLEQQKEYRKKHLFRTPRVSQTRIASKFDLKACSSTSVISDKAFSALSSDVKSDFENSA